MVIVACVTSGFVAPGVQPRSGKPFRLRHEFGGGIALAGGGTLAAAVVIHTARRRCGFSKAEKCCAVDVGERKDRVGRDAALPYFVAMECRGCSSPAGSR